MIYSHQLTYSLLADSTEEFSATFYGSSLEMQELELVLSRKLLPQDIFQKGILDLIEGVEVSYNGKLEYILELSYNEKLKKIETAKEEDHVI